ncbi:AAA family ATPase [Caldivirga sp.]|uniref:AAA family ATPase n=1 Tax=Caldivirga sp. TaxID=2080243 RepID=UPI003D0AD1AD
MIRPRLVIITFLSGGKGGAGTSTLTVNTAVALSESFNNPVLVVDMGYGANATATKLFGKNPGTTGVYDFIFSKAKPNVLKADEYKVYIIPNGAEDPNQIAYRLAQQFASRPEQFTRELTVTLRGFLQRTAVNLGVNHIIIDLPSTAVGAHFFATVASSDIINIVATAGVTHADEAKEAYSLIEFNTGSIVNVIVNNVLPIADSTAQFRGLTRNGGSVIPLSYSFYVKYITDFLRDIALAYDIKDRWRRDFDDYINVLKKQIGIVMKRKGT